MKRLLISICLIYFSATDTGFSQGCVAIRSNGASNNTQHPMIDSTTNGWQLTASYRYFRSFRHYKGRTEQKERLEKNTEVINWQHTVDISLSKQIDHRWSLMVGLPFIRNDRSSLYEHGLKTRHSTSSQGIGDLRIVAQRWMLNPHNSMKFNFQLGAGIKLPTGDYKYKDDFYNVGPEGSAEKRPVDQSIQLGDGGVGAIVELNTFYNLSTHFNLYANFYYLINPRNTNGTRTYLETLNPKFGDDRREMSVPDQYMVRGGVNYTFGGALHGLNLGSGVRMEGLPADDLIGKSRGWRRPGYVVSIEPNVNFTVNNLSFFASVPVALQRNRIQSVQDKEESAKTGTKVIGDAAFADYSLNFGASLRF